jgi:hypothetical protein
MTELEATTLIPQIDDYEFENTNYDHDYWCDAYLIRMTLNDGTELDDATLEAFSETNAGDCWKFEVMQDYLF